MGSWAIIIKKKKKKTFTRAVSVNSKMTDDDVVDEAMETEILPSTSNGDARIKEKDNKFANLPWYVFISDGKLHF